MTTLQGYATSVAPVTDIACAYASAPYEPVPTADPSPWVVFGVFTVPQSVSARLIVLAVNSGPAALSLKLFNPTAMENTLVLVPASGQVETVQSFATDLEPNTKYQIAAQYLGASGKAVINTVSLGAP